MYAIDDVIKIRGKHWLLPTLSIYIYLTFFSTAGRIPQKRISLMNVGCLSIGACRGPLRTAHSPARENEVYHYIYCVRQFSLSLSMLGLRSIFPFIYPFRNEISYLILYKREDDDGLAHPLPSDERYRWFFFDRGTVGCTYSPAAMGYTGGKI
jgi:hypothetical protein